VLEATALALAGAAIGALSAWLAFDGRELYSGGVFRLHVSAPLVWLGARLGGGDRVARGVFPAVRAGKVSAAEALREV